MPEGEAKKKHCATCKYYKFNSEGILVCSECGKPSEKYRQKMAQKIEQPPLIQTPRAG